MEELIARFSHIAKQIFEQLDNKSLTNCREVAKSWKKFIDERNFKFHHTFDSCLNVEKEQTFKKIP